MSKETETADIRDGSWIDKWGACRVCDGEIPDGHTNNCDLYKMECQIKDLERQRDEAMAALSNIKINLESITSRYEMLQLRTSDYESKLTTSNARLRELELVIADLKADKERLDWLEKNPISTVSFKDMGDGRNLRLYSDHGIFYGCSDHGMFYGCSFREALSDAIAQTKAKEGGK